MDDKEIVRRTLTQSRHHYRLIIEKYGDFLYGLGMRLTRGDKYLAEDISQEAFLRSYKYLHNFDSSQNFKKWLVGIFYNSFKDAIRKNRHDDALDENMVSQTTIEPSYASFFDLIKYLTDDEKIVFTLKYIYEYSNSEISEITNIKERQLKEVIKNGKGKISEQL